MKTRIIFRFFFFFFPYSLLMSLYKGVFVRRRGQGAVATSQKTLVQAPG